jgi:hypothetical protein
MGAAARPGATAGAVPGKIDAVSPVPEASAALSQLAISGLVQPDLFGQEPIQLALFPESEVPRSSQDLDMVKASRAPPEVTLQTQKEPLQLDLFTSPTPAPSITSPAKVVELAAWQKRAAANPKAPPQPQFFEILKRVDNRYTGSQGENGQDHWNKIMDYLDPYPNPS